MTALAGTAWHLALPGAPELLDAAQARDHQLRTLAEDADLARRVAHQHRPRVVAVTVAPDVDDHLGWLAWAILEQLGKDPDLQRTPTAAQETWALAELWLRAHGTATLIVIGAEQLTVRLWRNLAAMTSANLAVLLINQTLTRGQRDLLSRSDSAITPLYDTTFWADQYRTRRTRDNRDLERRAAPFVFPAVPVDEQPFFRHACRRLLSSEDFAVVDRAYRHAYEHTTLWLRRPPKPLLEEHAGAFLAELIRNARGGHEQLTRLRGAQAAFWRHRWLLKVRPDALAAAYRVTTHGIDRTAAAALLGTYLSPRTAALGAVALRTQLPPARLALLNADQLTDDCCALELGDDDPVSLGVEQVLLHAPRLDSNRHKHSANGPLFCGTDGQRLRPNTLQQILRRTATETGLPLTQTWTPPVDRQHAFWMHRRGLTLQPLAPPSAGP